MSTKGYTDRSNCIRAARKALDLPTGKAGVDFQVSTGEDGLYYFSPIAAQVTAPAEILADVGSNDNLASDGDLLNAVAAAMEAGTLAQTPQVMAMKEKAAAKPKRADMATLMGASLCSLTINSEKNGGYQKHANALFEAAKAGDRKTLANYNIKGTNTYCRMLRRYRDGLLAAVQSKAA